MHTQIERNQKSGTGTSRTCSTIVTDRGYPLRAAESIVEFKDDGTIIARLRLPGHVLQIIESTKPLDRDRLVESYSLLLARDVQRALELRAGVQGQPRTDFGPHAFDTQRSFTFEAGEVRWEIPKDEAECLIDQLRGKHAEN